jgi:hypothetical protein
MIPQILIDTEKNSALATRGYVIVDFLSAETVQSISDFYSANPNNFPNAFHATHFNTDVSYKGKVQHFLFESLDENFRQQFISLKPVFANFMVKEGGGNNVMPLHADWTYVDENICSSYSVWIPLVDTNINNGCIGVIPYSHLLSHAVRGPGFLQWKHPAEITLINELGELLPMKRGQALIYNHRTMHYSLPNNSSTVRPSINISLVPKGEKIIHYAVPQGETEVLKFEVTDTNFFLDYDNFQMPRHGTVVERIKVENIPLINERLEAFIQKHKRKGLLPALKKIITDANRRLTTR